MPQFEIRIEGVGLPRDVLRDVAQVTYKDNIKEIDSFELTVNNWDAATRALQVRRRRDRRPTQGRRRTTAQRYRLFEPCNKEVEVRMGYLGDLRTLRARHLHHAGAELSRRAARRR